MTVRVSPAIASATEPAALAQHWYAALADSYLQRNPSPVVVNVPMQSADVLAALSTVVLQRGKSLLILVPDDEFLPALSNALDLSLRPLCLVLPSADFAARIALRATLSLLRSRLARDSDDEQTAEWAAQRQRVVDLTPIWDAAQSWNASNERTPWPDDVAQIFPARILPIAAYRSLPDQAADVVVFFQCHTGIDAMSLDGWQLHIGIGDYSATRHSVALGDETVRLQVELAQLTQDVGELELELATAQAEMGEFTQRYYRQIGRRMTELDVLQAKLATAQAATLKRSVAANRDADRASAASAAETQAERLRQQAEISRREEQRFADASSGDASLKESEQGFRPDKEVKRLFRQLAQRIHPDRADSEDDRTWRTQLMSEANRAYRAGDGETLREIASLWEEGRPAVVVGSSAVVTPKNVLMQQIARMRNRFNEIKGELHKLFGSRLYELFLAARQVGRWGRDLLQEMADKLDAQIANALTALASIS